MVNTIDDGGGSGTGGYTATDSAGGLFEGDGSNDWWGGVEDVAEDPVGEVSDPYDFVAGAADAAALQFDEGAGGLYSLVDGEEGNTAGPGDTEMWTPTEDDLNRTADDVEDWWNDSTPDPPGWLAWTIDNQEAVALLVVLLAFAWATNGTVGVGGGSSG